MSIHPLPSRARFFACALFAVLVAATLVSADPAPPPAITFHALPEASYDAAATVSGYATKVFLSGQPGTSAEDALRRLAGELNALGLSPANLANVRGSLLDTPDHPFSMAPWNAAWERLYAEPAPRATRTTVAAVALPGANTRVVAEAVAAFHAEPEGSVPGRPSLNPFVRFHGEGAHGASASAIVLPGTALFFSSGILADPADPRAPENSVARFGSVAAQTRSIFAKLEDLLLREGFQWEDIFYVRGLLSPDPETGETDFAGFGETFEAHFPGRHPRLRPALTIWSAPGFAPTGRLVEVEIYAAAADGRGPFIRFDTDRAHPGLQMTGTEAARISSSGTVARYQALTWFSGAIGTASDDLHEESISTLLTLLRRLRDLGLDFDATVHLRAYPVVGEAFSAKMGDWNQAYGRFFALPVNPHKPARTSFPVTALPGQRAIEVEILAIGP
ncbi:MAG: hypothetical protein JJT96_17625 [Opitutales bacterium]|nr:hypothetical protein [Opitutales bacterium]